MDKSCNVKCNVCDLLNKDATEYFIEITHEKTGDDVVATPHFCKSFCKK